MCSLHLTHPSGAVGSRHCGARGAVGGSVPCSRVSPQSWTWRARASARARIQTHNLGLPRVSSPTLYPLGHDCPVIIDPSQRPAPFSLLFFVNVQQAMALSHHTQNKYKTDSALKKIYFLKKFQH